MFNLLQTAKCTHAFDVNSLWQKHWLTFFFFFKKRQNSQHAESRLCMKQVPRFGAAILRKNLQLFIAVAPHKQRHALLIISANVYAVTEACSTCTDKQTVIKYQLLALLENFVKQWPISARVQFRVGRQMYNPQREQELTCCSEKQNWWSWLMS